jgi:hypothetical protein
MSQRLLLVTFFTSNGIIAIPSVELVGDSVGCREGFGSSATTLNVWGFSQSVYIKGSFGDEMKNTVSAVCKISESRW